MPTPTRASNRSRRGLLALALALLALAPAAAPASAAAALVSDEFDGSALDTETWSFVDPIGDATLELDGATAAISLPEGSSHDLWDGREHAPRLVQPAPDVDFEVEAGFASAVSAAYQLQGIVVEQDAGDHVRVEINHDGKQTKVFAATSVDGKSTTRHWAAVGDDTRHLRLARAGSTWTLRHSADGAAWTTAAVFDHALTVRRIGPFAGNVGWPPPAFTARVDHFRVLSQATPAETTDPSDGDDGSGGGETFTGDEFDGSALDAAWRVYDPVGDASVSMADGRLSVGVPAGVSHDLWRGALRSPRVLRAAPDGDFEIEAKYDGAATETIQSQGLIAQADRDDFVRFDVYHANGATRAFAATFVDGEPTTRANVSVPGGAPVRLRMRRTGSTWTLLRSADGSTWTEVASFDFPLAVAEVGVFALNAGSSPPAFTALVDHFRILGEETAEEPPPAEEPSGGPAIRVWHGEPQRFGDIGFPQRWLNVLGRADDPDGVAEISYRLDGGPATALVHDPAENARIDEPGDFNVQLDRTAIAPGTHVLTLTAVDGVGNVSERSVDLEVGPERTWPLPFETDWTLGLQRTAQVVDGHWKVEGGSARTVEPGYDRTIALGAESWAGLDVTVPVTIHSFEAGAPHSGVGVATGWRGHEGGKTEPWTGWPLGGFCFYYKTWEGGSHSLYLFYYGWPPYDSGTGRDWIELGVPYVFRMRTEPIDAQSSRYSCKVWRAGDPEPSEWAVSEIMDRRDGSVLLVADYADVTFGKVSVTP